MPWVGGEQTVESYPLCGELSGYEREVGKRMQDIPKEGYAQSGRGK